MTTAFHHCYQHISLSLVFYDVLLPLELVYGPSQSLLTSSFSDFVQGISHTQVLQWHSPSFTQLWHPTSLSQCVASPFLDFVYGIRLTLVCLRHSPSLSMFRESPFIECYQGISLPKLLLRNHPSISLFRASPFLEFLRVSLVLHPIIRMSSQVLSKYNHFFLRLLIIGTPFIVLFIFILSFFSFTSLRCHHRFYLS